MSTRKQVWQYHCDFCPKHNLSAASIAKHEKHCTANPNRTCRMCPMLKVIQKPIGELISCLDLEKADCGVAGLHDKADGCPACILAAIRQSRIREIYKEKFSKEWEQTGPLDLKFDYKAAVAEVWATINKESYEAEMRSEMYG